MEDIDIKFMLAINNGFDSVDYDKAKKYIKIFTEFVTWDMEVTPFVFSSSDHIEGYSC